MLRSFIAGWYMHWMHPQRTVVFDMDVDGFPLRLTREYDVELGRRLSEFSPFTPNRRVTVVSMDEANQRTIAETYAEFYRAGESFLFTRQNVSESVLVMNPRAPADFAFQGEYFYANFLDTHSSFFYTSVRIIDSDGQHSIHHPDGGAEQTFLTCIQMLMGDATYVPHLVLNDFLEAIDRHHGFRRLWNEGIYARYRIPREILPSFPQLMLSFEPSNRSGNPGGLGFAPADYLEHVRDDIYRFKIVGHSTYQIWIGRHILKTLTVHIDNWNGRIGFGDALYDDPSA